MAPANANAPPAIHAARNSSGCGIAAATWGGVNRMPPPITLDTMIAAASNGPSRRSSVLLREELTRDGIFAELGPIRTAVLGEELNVGVHELAVFHHHGAGLDARVAEGRFQGDRSR